MRERQQHEYVHFEIGNLLRSIRVGEVKSVSVLALYPPVEPICELRKLHDAEIVSRMTFESDSCNVTTSTYSK